MAFSITVAPRPGELYTHTAIRGVAALCVVGYHAMLGSSGPAHTGNPLQNYFLNSFIFVDFFFILSGFIMHESYGHKILRSQIISSTLTFWKKRFFKIIPNYYVWLFIAAIFVFIRWSYFGDRNATDECIQLSLLKHALFVQNLSGSCYYFNVPLWSIAVEMIAYLFFPLIVLSRFGWQATLVSGLGLYLLLFSYYETIDIIDGASSVYRCLAGFLCGVAAAQSSFRNWSSAVQLISALLLVAAISMDLQIAAIGLMLLVTIATSNNNGILANISKMKLPYIIGRSSFSIYLAHIPVAMVVSVIAYKVENRTGIPLGSDWKFSLPMNILASCTVGFFAYEFIERRFEHAAAKRNVPAVNSLS